jgi:hypothetical protein
MEEATEETKENLIKETKKWLGKIKTERESIILRDSMRTDFVENIDAYISDSEFFLENQDVVEAFEAVIWAWAYMEIGKDLQILEMKN